LNGAQRLILQAGSQTTSYSAEVNLQNKTRFNFLFLPLHHSLPSNENSRLITVLVFGTYIVEKEVTRSQKKFLDSISSLLTSFLSSYHLREENQRLRDQMNKMVVQREQEKQQQYNLRHASLYWNAILNSLSDIMIICTDVNGVITYFSPGAEALLGYSSSEMVGHETPLKLHALDEVEQRALQLEKEIGVKTQGGFDTLVVYAQRGMIETRTWTYMRSNGIPVSVQLSVQPLIVGSKHVGFLGIGRLKPRKKKPKQKYFKGSPF